MHSDDSLHFVIPENWSSTTQRFLFFLSSFFLIMVELVFSTAYLHIMNWFCYQMIRTCTQDHQLLVNSIWYKDYMIWYLWEKKLINYIKFCTLNENKNKNVDLPMTQFWLSSSEQSRQLHRPSQTLEKLTHASLFLQRNFPSYMVQFWESTSLRAFSSGSKVSDKIKNMKRHKYR